MTASRKMALTLLRMRLPTSAHGLSCSAPARRVRGVAGTVQSEAASSTIAADFTACFERRVASGNLTADTSQQRAVQLLANGLSRASELATGRSGEQGPDFWEKPTRTLGTAEAGAAESERQRVAAYTSRLASDNARRVKKQAAARKKASSSAASADSSEKTAGSSETQVKSTSSSDNKGAASEGGSSASKKSVAESGAVDKEPAKKKAPARPVRQSVYMHGSVGTGKTMLLDIFFEESRKAGLRVVRQHFYEFMMALHAEIHKIEEQPVESAANKMADNVDVLCFDEFQITDIQDACILPRVFEVLFLRGIVVIMTSNTAPALLYSGGLNRHVHIPALINLLGDYCHVLRLGGTTSKSSVDYRRKAEAQELAESSSDKQLEGDGYLCGPDADDLLRSRWTQLTQGSSSPAPEQLQLPMGRRLDVAQATANACFVPFSELCGADRGEAEFLTLAKRFSTIAVSSVPSFESLQAADEVKRFVKLLDVLYDCRIRLIVAAAAPIDDLFAGIRKDVQQGDIMWRTALYSSDGKAGMAPGAVGTLCEAIQATERAESRLREMRTRRYAEECMARHSE